MRKVVVSAGQSLIDVCLQELGSTAALFDLADVNGLPITAALQPGQQLLIPEASLLAAPEVAAYYAGRSYRVNVPDPLLRVAPDALPVLPVHRQLLDFLAADVLPADFL